MVRRMPRMQVYLPDELYKAVKERQLPASELLQEAVEAELRRQRLNEEAERYVAELVAEVGEPSVRERARAAAIARRSRERAAARAS
jgi:post-segregation antitoxin (ccd killing protein)